MKLRDTTTAFLHDYAEALRAQRESETRREQIERISQFAGGTALMLVGAYAHFRVNGGGVPDIMILGGFMAALETTPQLQGDQGSE